MSGDLQLLNPATEDQLASALLTAASFNDQTVERVNAMKFMVLKVFDGDDRNGGTIPTGNDQYSKDITTKIVSLVEGRAEAVDQFKKAQEFYEIMLANLKKRLAVLRT